ncbi:MAG: LysR family transcriptional regulator [Ramlibacter sp.]
MQTEFIDSFVTVVDCGSVAEAARRLNLTPTALAQRIAALESEFGCPLVVRSGRTVRPTEGGLRLAAGARNLQRALRELRAGVLGDEVPTHLRLGSISTALAGWLPRRLDDLVRHQPRIDIQIEAGVSRDLYHSLLHDQLDVALIVAPPFALPKSIRWRTVREEPLIVLAHRRFANADPLVLLATEPLIRYDRHNWGGSLADQYLQAHRIRPRERVELDELQALEVLVGLGLGVSLVPDWARASALPANLVALRLPGDAPARTIGLAWPTGSAHTAVVDLLTGEAPTA